MADSVQPTAIEPATDEVAVDDLKQLYFHLLKTRLFDERCRRLFKQGRFPGTYFSCVGQEAVSVGTVYGTRADDLIAPANREFGAFITRGMPLVAMLRQMFARANSPDRGKSHPCHFGYPELSILTPASTVTAQLLLGVGAALAFKMQNRPNVALCFVGDGSTSRGAFHEGLNFAAIHRLPAVIICANNLWAESVPTRLQSNTESFADRALAYGIPAQSIDGNDVQLVHRTMRAAIEQARTGGGPSFVECRTYRWYGHSEIDPADYRTDDEVNSWKEKDPLARIEDHLMKRELISIGEREEFQMQIESEIEEAIAQAEASPHPRAQDALEDVYSFSPAANYSRRG